MLSSCDIPIHYDTFKLEEESLGIFTYFGGKQTEAQSYYDSDEAQTFYSSIWGEHTIHIGRYDLTDAGLQGPSAASTDRILNAAMLHEVRLCATADNESFVLNRCNAGGHRGARQEILRAFADWSHSCA